MRYTAVILFAACLLTTAPLAAQTSAPPDASNARPMAGPAFLALVDINKASKYDLEGLPGVDADLAQAIIKGRPYRHKDDLVGRKIVPQEIYDNIKNRIIAAE